MYQGLHSILSALVILCYHNDIHGLLKTVTTAYNLFTVFFFLNYNTQILDGSHINIHLFRIVPRHLIVFECSLLSVPQIAQQT